MLKKTLFFSSPCHVKIHNRQLVILNKVTGEEHQRPVEDLGFVVFDHPQITFTQSVIQLLAEHNAAVIFCDQKHHPASMLFHLDSHQTQTEHFRAQVEASEPLKKQLWKQTVKAKIRNQAAVLDLTGGDGEAMRTMARKVKSGDTENMEARAARHYWQRLFGHAFTRARFGDAPNHILNYGYTVLRAAVARALTGSGLLPTLGIHHHNKYNAFCLADDIMEPYRPYVDQLVWELVQQKLVEDELTPPMKAKLLECLSCDVHMGKKTRPLMVGLSETSASLVRCFKGSSKTIRYPVL